MRLLATTAAALCLTATGALAHGDDECAVGKTLEDGVLTIATGNPAFYPWVLNDAPESGEGFEAAVAYAIAAEMGFDADAVTWVRTSFDEAIQPGPKETSTSTFSNIPSRPEREQMVDFSLP